MSALSKESLLLANGYNPAFINSQSVLGIKNLLPPHLKTKLPVVEGNIEGILNYSNLSVFYHIERKLPIVSAYNIDGGSKASKIKRTSFRKDSRIDRDLQLGNDFYTLRTDITEFEIGHMAANNEMAWGELAQSQSYQTFFFPNSVPQAERLNTGIWKNLETYIISEAASNLANKRICVFTGPVLSDSDPEYKYLPGFKLPLLFFKVVVFATKKGLCSTAFVMSHEKKMLEDDMLILKPQKVGAAPGAAQLLDFEDFPYRKVFQINIPTLEEMTGLTFNWKGVAQINVPKNKNQIKQIKSVGSVAEIPTDVPQKVGAASGPIKVGSAMVKEQLVRKTNILFDF